MSRAGAIAISELCVVGKPVILIPSPNVAENHQFKNAQSLVNKNAAILVKDSQANNKLVEEIVNLKNNPILMKKLSKNIKEIILFGSDDEVKFKYDDGYNAADDNPTVDESRDKFYNSWLHIVTETYQVNGQTFFSEKIFKPIIYWQPFILIGAQYDLRSFRSFGYKTFHGIIDESYDVIQNSEERLEACIKEIERIINLSDEDIAKLYNDCYEILTHYFFHWVYRNQTIHIGLKNDLLEKLNG